MTDQRPPDELEQSTYRWQLSGLVLLVLFIGIFPLYRIYEPTQREDAREEQTGFLAALGEEIYDAQCSTCHGVAGRGGLGPALGARNFLESVDDDQILQLTALGIPGTEMVSYSIDYGGPMTDSELRAVTTYLRSLEEDSENYANWQTPLVDENLSAEDLYSLACSRCHGVDLAGVEDLGPDLGPTSFALEESDEWLADRIVSGRNEMPRFGRVLTTQQVDMLVALLRGIDVVATPTTIPPTDTTQPPATGTTTTTVADGVDPEVLALGKEIYDITAGGEGCASCHGFDGRGGEAPGIIGSSKSAILNALGGGIPDMDNIKLNRDELDAVYEYLRTLLP